MMQTPVRFALALTLIAPAVACSEPPPPSKPVASSAPAPLLPDPPAERAPAGTTRSRTVYVPAYSHLPTDTDKRRGSLLSILLSVRNVDSSATVTLTHVDYFDTSGHRVRRYLTAPRQLRPLETAEFRVPTLDEAGGSGANFLVYWEGPSDAHPLLTETVMFGQLRSSYMGFTSRGVELDRRPDLKGISEDDAPAQDTPPETEGGR